MRKLATLVAALLVSSSTFAATPSEGVPLEVRRGFFTETDVGGIFTVGGLNQNSNLQTYLQLGLGYQLTLGGGRSIIPIGLHVGIGANAQNCWAEFSKPETCSQSDNFTMTFVNLSAGYLHELIERFYLGAKLLGGLTLLDPRPVADPSDPTNTGLMIKPNFGAALSIEYATNMDHFSVGLDVVFRLIVGPNINAIMFYPRVQYTF